eukprot:scaffold4971_cov254-Pinguiococcus_pyrenoidosus.AAC.5
MLLVALWSGRKEGARCGRPFHASSLGRFLLDTDSFEVLLNAGDELTKSGENIVVGGENRWKYSTFTNWKFFPSENVPILVYFKETQTKPEGQIHFFPVVCNGQQLLESMTGRNIPRLEES